MNETGFQAAKALIDGAKRIVISGHLSPDGDTIGSAIAMAWILGITTLLFTIYNLKKLSNMEFKTTGK